MMRRKGDPSRNSSKSALLGLLLLVGVAVSSTGCFTLGPSTREVTDRSVLGTKTTAPIPVGQPTILLIRDQGAPDDAVDYNLRIEQRCVIRHVKTIQVTSVERHHVSTGSWVTYGLTVASTVILLGAGIGILASDRGGDEEDDAGREASGAIMLVGAGAAAVPFGIYTGRAAKARGHAPLTYNEDEVTEEPVPCDRLADVAAFQVRWTPEYVDTVEVGERGAVRIPFPSPESLIPAPPDSATISVSDVAARVVFSDGTKVPVDLTGVAPKLGKIYRQAEKLREQQVEALDAEWRASNNALAERLVKGAAAVISRREELGRQYQTMVETPEEDRDLRQLTALLASYEQLLDDLRQLNAEMAGITDYPLKRYRFLPDALSSTNSTKVVAAVLGERDVVHEAHRTLKQDVDWRTANRDLVRGLKIKGAAVLAQRAKLSKQYEVLGAGTYREQDNGARRALLGRYDALLSGAEQLVGELQAVEGYPHPELRFMPSELRSVKQAEALVAQVRAERRNLDALLNWKKGGPLPDNFVLLARILALEPPGSQRAKQANEKLRSLGTSSVEEVFPLLRAMSDDELDAVVHATHVIYFGTKGVNSQERGDQLLAEGRVLPAVLMHATNYYTMARMYIAFRNNPPRIIPYTGNPDADRLAASLNAVTRALQRLPSKMNERRPFIEGLRAKLPPEDSRAGNHIIDYALSIYP